MMAFRIRFQWILRAAIVSAAFAGGAFAVPMAIAQAPDGSLPPFASGSQLAEPSPNSDEALVASIQLAPIRDADDFPVITAMALSPNAKYLAAAGDDHAVRIIETESLQTIATLRGHSDWVQAVCFSDDGNTLVSGGNDRTLIRWERDSEWRLTDEVEVANAIATIDFDATRGEFAYGGFGPFIWFYSLDERRNVRQFVCECRDQRRIEFSDDGRRLACGGRDGVLRVWDVEKEVEILERQSHRGRIRGVDFGSDSERIVTVGEDKRVQRFDLATGELEFDRRLSGGKLFAVSQVDSMLLAIATSDNSIRLFCLVEMKEVGRLDGHLGTVDAICSTERLIYSGSHDTTIKVWDVERAWELRTRNVSINQANHDGLLEPAIR